MFTVVDSATHFLFTKKLPVRVLTWAFTTRIPVCLSRSVCITIFFSYGTTEALLTCMTRLLACLSATIWLLVAPKICQNATKHEYESQTTSALHLYTACVSQFDSQVKNTHACSPKNTLQPGLEYFLKREIFYWLLVRWKRLHGNSFSSEEAHLIHFFGFGQSIVEVVVKVVVDITFRLVD